MIFISVLSVTLYNCSVGRSDCSRCHTADQKYSCVWCGNVQARCVYSESCSEHVQNTCPAPVIHSVSSTASIIQAICSSASIILVVSSPALVMHSEKPHPIMQSKCRPAPSYSLYCYPPSFYTPLGYPFKSDYLFLY